MKIGIVGATGSFGKGLAYYWAKRHTVYIGSRSPEKGEQRAEDYRLELWNHGIKAIFVGTSNDGAISNGEVIVLSVKYEHLTPLLADASQRFRDKIVISPVVALKKERIFQYVPPAEGSVALLIQRLLPQAAVVAALHTVPANRLQRLEMTLEGDVPVCGDDPGAKATVISLIKEIEELNPIDAGPLEVSRMVEPMVPLILNLKQHSLKKNVSVKFV